MDFPGTSPAVWVRFPYQHPARHKDYPNSDYQIEIFDQQPDACRVQTFGSSFPSMPKND
jgi:hypothetical protein